MAHVDTLVCGGNLVQEGQGQVNRVDGKMAGSAIRWYHRPTVLSLLPAGRDMS